MDGRGAGGAEHPADGCPGVREQYLHSPLEHAPGVPKALVAPAPALIVLRDQVWLAAPYASRLLDGILRDPRVGPASDHHVGNALDLTHDPEHGRDVGVLARDLVRQMRANPVGGRLSYVIWDRHIASARNGWHWKPYGRSCPHVRHVHLSLKASHRREIRPWTVRTRGCSRTAE